MGSSVGEDSSGVVLGSVVGSVSDVLGSVVDSLSDVPGSVADSVSVVFSSGVSGLSLTGDGDIWMSGVHWKSRP